MKKIILTLISIYVFSGCLERGALIKHEKGIVVEKQYFPNTQRIVSGVGFSSSGSTVVTSHSVGEAEKYMVIFKCEHGIVFSINKSEIYGKLNKGDSVIIDYYEMLKRDGKVGDFDFVDASKIK